MKKPELPMHPVATIQPETDTSCLKPLDFYSNFRKYCVAGSYTIPVQALEEFFKKHKDKKNLKLYIENLEDFDDTYFTFESPRPNKKYTTEYKKWEKDRKHYWEIRMPKYEKLKEKYDKDFKKWESWQKDQEFKELEKKYKKALKDKEARLSK